MCLSGYTNKFCVWKVNTHFPLAQERYDISLDCTWDVKYEVLIDETTFCTTYHFDISTVSTYLMIFSSSFR